MMQLLQYIALEANGVADTTIFTNNNQDSTIATDREEWHQDSTITARTHRVSVGMQTQ
jgi:hypothetical protein